VGTGGKTLDPLVTTTVTSGAGETNLEDPSGNPNFNAENIEAGTGEFWGVMGLTLNQNGYAWDFESALKDPAQTTGPASYSDRGVGACHGPASRSLPDRVCQVRLDIASERIPPSRDVAKGEFLLLDRDASVEMTELVKNKRLKRKPGEERVG
jgi:hypothetical protein